jgi:peptide/nickel transport system permease protein
MLNSAEANQAALNGWWWWILFPGIMIVIVSAPFVMVGYAIDKIVSPRVGVK